MNSSPIVLAVLSVYRIAMLLFQDDGPFNMIANLRSYLYNRSFDVSHKRHSDKIKERIDYEISTTINDIFECPFCLGLWASVFIWILLKFKSKNHQWPDIILLVFGIAGAQHIIERVLQQGERE